MALGKTEKTTRKPLIWITLAVLAIGLIFSTRYFFRDTIPVRVTTVTRGELQLKLSTNGKVQPAQNFEAHSPSAGIVRQVYVHEGDVVPAGKLLLALNDTDARARVAAALTQLRAAEAQADALQHGGTADERLSLIGDRDKAQIERDQAAASLATLQKLQASGSASPSEVSAAQQRLKSAEATLHNLDQRKTGRYGSLDLSHASASVADAKASYEAALQTLNESNVRAPFAGTVYSISVGNTEYVQPGATLLQMADLTRIQVLAYFDEPEIIKLSVGKPVTIQWEALPGRIWHGHVKRVPSTVITYGTRNVGEVTVDVDDSEGALLPNTNVTITVVTLDKPDVLTIPREALHSEATGTFVFAVRDHKLRQLPVKIGSLNLTEVEIVSGVSEHDVIAVGSANGQPLSEGLQVRVVR